MNQTEEEIPSNTEKAPEDFHCDGAARERSKNPKRRSKGSFKKLNSANRLHGVGYIKFNTSNLVPPKSVGVRCSGICKKIGKKCDSFSDNDRKKIFDAFYELSTPQLQREFICRHVERGPKNVSGENPRPTYFLSIRWQRLKVCQKFFLETLAISERVVRTSMEKLSEVGTVELDKRGGRVENNQQRDELIRELVNQHIDRFPRIESHFCRQNTNREYLCSDLSLTKMHRMFCNEQSEGQTSVSFTFYSKIFHGKNLSFHHPKKDQCTLCNTYRTGDQATKERYQKKYDLHIREKEAIRKIKEKCKKESVQSPLIASPVFDLEQVFTFPKSPESLVFYKRRLTAFNLTIYELGSRDCFCNFWDETMSRRGSSEIASCLYIYLKDLDGSGHVKVNLFADGCPGQNKNTIVASMLIFFIRTSKNVKEVSLRFFETNHGQNEGDSAHSAISTAMEAEGEILVPSKMPAIFEKARINQPYKVRSMNANDFLDFKSYSKSLNILSMRRNDDASGSINWTEIMEMRVIKISPKTLFYKNSHCWSDYKSITLKNNGDKCIAELNPERLKIPAAKYEDLLSLCVGDLRVIRQNEHVEFYKNLPHQAVSKATKKSKIE